MTRADPRALAAIALGGVVGTLARVALSEADPHGPAQWPWATFAVNVLGAFVIGWVVEALARREATARSELVRFALTTGFCGALTTFSTFLLELLGQLSAGAVGLAVGYLAASVVGGRLAVAAGVAVGRGPRTEDPETERVAG